MSTASTGSLTTALELVGDRWTLVVIEALLDGPRRFGDLRAAIGSIAPNILSARLKRLESAGLVVSRPYSRRPPRQSYDLTADGRELAGALRLLSHWGARTQEGAEGPRHADCGTPMEARWYCPTCDRSVSDASDELHYL